MVNRHSFFDSQCTMPSETSLECKSFQALTFSHALHSNFMHFSQSSALSLNQLTLFKYLNKIICNQSYGNLHRNCPKTNHNDQRSSQLTAESRRCPLIWLAFSRTHSAAVTSWSLCAHQSQQVCSADSSTELHMTSTLCLIKKHPGHFQLYLEQAFSDFNNFQHKYYIEFRLLKYGLFSHLT